MDNNNCPFNGFRKCDGSQGCVFYEGIAGICGLTYTSALVLDELKSIKDVLSPAAKESAKPEPVRVKPSARTADIEVDRWVYKFNADHFVGRYTFQVYEDYKRDVAQGITQDVGAKQRKVTSRIMAIHNLRAVEARKSKHFYVFVRPGDAS